jgi:hypothetical protein
MPINTLEFARRMTKAGFTREQAEAQAELFAEIVESDLATKRDLKDVEAKLSRDIKELEVRMSGFQADVKRDLKELELKMWQMTLGSAVLVTVLVGFMLRFVKP